MDRQKRGQRHSLDQAALEREALGRCALPFVPVFPY